MNMLVAYQINAVHCGCRALRESLDRSLSRKRESRSVLREYQKIPRTRRGNRLKARYPFEMQTNSSPVRGMIGQAGVPALRIAFTLTQVWLG